MLNPQQERLLIDIYNRHFTKVYRYFYYKTLDRSSSEDLTSDTFLRFADTVSKDSKIEDYVKFLYGIANNVFQEFLRKKYQGHLVSGVDWDEISVESVDNLLDGFDLCESSKTPLEDIVKKYVKLLPEKQKDVISLRLIEKLSLKEICVKLGKDMNYVKTTQKRAIKSLKHIAMKIK